jgi:hypothetical protein
MKFFTSICPFLISTILTGLLSGCAEKKQPSLNSQKTKSIIILEDDGVILSEHLAEKQSITSCWDSISTGMTQEEIETLAGKPDEMFLSPKNMMPLFARSLFEMDPHWIPEVAIMFTSTVLDPDLYKKNSYDKAWVYRTTGSGRTKRYYIFFDINKKVVRLSKPSDPDRKHPINKLSLEVGLQNLDRIEDIDFQYDPADIQNIYIEDPKIGSETFFTNSAHKVECLLQPTCATNNLELIKKVENGQIIYWIKKKQIEPPN